MPKLQVHRISEFKNRARKITLKLDNEPIAKIKNGEKLEFDIPVGKHTLEANIDWCSSNLLELETDDHSMIAVILSSGDGSSLFNIFFKTKDYLKLTKTNK